MPTNAAAVPADYTIGPQDVLSIVYWHDKDMTADVTVRPDGGFHCRSSTTCQPPV